MHSTTEGKGKGEHEPIDWIVANIELRESNAAEFWYDRMESQSGRRLPVIYKPFDGRQRDHFAGSGQILDFAVVAGPGRVLDFGPGDGWPSLLIAPMVDEVVGVDGSQRRVEVCTSNAERLGIDNASFVHVPPGQPLPFEDDSFDGVTAASSIEQTPDPKATLTELHRILKPGGKLRMDAEWLDYYRGGHEREIAEGDPEERPSRLLIFDRNIDEETVRHYGLLFDLARAEVGDIFARNGGKPSYAALTPEVLSELSRHVVDAAAWTTRHPSCRTWLRWLKEIGFSSATATYNGNWFASRLFDRLDESRRPREIDAVDDLLRPLIEVVVTLEAPIDTTVPGEWGPEMITAVR